MVLLHGDFVVCLFGQFYNTQCSTEYLCPNVVEHFFALHSCPQYILSCTYITNQYVHSLEVDHMPEWTQVCDAVLSVLLLILFPFCLNYAETFSKAKIPDSPVSDWMTPVAFVGVCCSKPVSEEYDYVVQQNLASTWGCFACGGLGWGENPQRLPLDWIVQLQEAESHW